MIPAEVIERAFESAYRKSCDEPSVANIAEAALRSLLTDLREESQLGGHTGTALPGWESAQPVIDVLLREVDHAE